MVRVRWGDELGIDLDRVIAWTFIKEDNDQQYLTSSLQISGYLVPALKVEERILLYTPRETLVVAKAAVGAEVFTNFHNCLLSLFEVDINAVRSSE
jgi:hypothetical protein